MKKIILFVILFICGFMLCNAVAHEQGQYIQVGDDYLGTAAILDKADTVTDTNTLPTGAAILAWGGAGDGGTGYWTQATDDIYYTDGKVAIGTSDFTGYDKTYIYTTSTTSGSKALKVRHHGTTALGTAYGAHITASGAGATNIALYATASGATSNYAGIFEEGNVGIGTTSPDTALEVVGIITATAGTSTNWNTAYTDRLKWDGGAGSLVAATGLTSLGLDGTASALTSGAYLVGVYDELEFSNADNVQDALADLDYAIANPTTFSEVKTGRVRFNSTAGREVFFVLPPMDDTDYNVFTTNFSQAVNVGEISIEDKTTTGFTLKNSGADVSSYFEYMVVPYTLRGSTQQQGTDTFNSTTGVTVTLAPNLDDTDYDVIISLPSQTLIEDIGAISVESKAVNQFVVKNSSPDTATTFNWLAVPYTLGGETDFSGTDTFNTPTGVTVTIGGDVGSIAYVVLITCASQTNLIDVGVVSIESKSQTDFVVKNSGAGTSEFEWRVFPQAPGAADMFRTVYDVDLGGHIDLAAGGLDADLSAYAGLLKISGGATSYITDSSTDWDTAYTHSQETTGAVHGATTNNTGNKIVRRDASGDFAANEITSDLVGNVTGNVVGDVTGDLTGTADEAVVLETARTIGGSSFDGSASIAVINVTVADTADTTSWVALWTDATGAALAPKSDGALTYNAGTGKLSATGFIGDFTGDLTGDVTGNVTGSSGSTTGNAATATLLANARYIGGILFTGGANIVPATNYVIDQSGDTSCNIAYFTQATGDLQLYTGTNLTFNSVSGKLTATGGFTDGTASMTSGALTGIVALTFTGADGVPTDPGMIGYDNVIAGMSGGGLRWRDNNSDRLLVDLETDPSSDDYVVAYDAAADGFYMKEDAEGGVGTTYTAGAGIGLTLTDFFVYAGAGLSQDPSGDGLKIGAGLVVNSMLAVNSVAATQIAANSVGNSELSSFGMVTAGTYICVSNITVDADGRITAITLGQ